ncbi:hypothetical protein CAAN3_20S00144 [[Candida] anglica]
MLTTVPTSAVGRIPFEQYVQDIHKKTNTIIKSGVNLIKVGRNDSMKDKIEHVLEGMKGNVLVVAKGEGIGKLVSVVEISMGKNANQSIRQFNKLEGFVERKKSSENSEAVNETADCVQVRTVPLMCVLLVHGSDGDEIERELEESKWTVQHR